VARPASAKEIDPYFNSTSDTGSDINKTKAQMKETIDKLINTVDRGKRIEVLNEQMKTFTLDTISLVIDISDVVANYASAWTNIQDDLKNLATMVSKNNGEESLRTIKQLTRAEMSKLFGTFKDSLDKLVRVLPGDNGRLKDRLSKSQTELSKVMDLADNYFKEASRTATK
jgi:cytochrome P450